MSSDESRRQAVALAYQDHERAPRVVAKGYGELAERIMAEAQRQGIYVHDAPELVALLMQLDLDAEIPANLYQVIAELLVWVFELSEAGLNKRGSAELPIHTLYATMSLGQLQSHSWR